MTELFTLLVAIASAIVAGILYAFSSFVMRALDALGPEAAVSAMQSVNRKVIHPSFLLFFLGAAGGNLALPVLYWGRPGFGLAMAGALLYLIGTFVVTVAANIPRNEALDRIDPAGREAAEAWSRYFREWTRWNHLRSAAGALAAILLLLART